MLKRLLKVLLCIAYIFMVCVSFPFLHAEVRALETQNQEKKEKDKPLSSIEELLNDQRYLFLEGEKPAVDLRGATILIQADTGQIIYSEDATIKLPIYSMTKVLSAYVMLDTMNDPSQKLRWDQELTINEHFAHLSQNPDYSGIGFSAGEKYTVAELFDLMMVISDNAATMVLAEAIAGSEKSFVDLMRQKLEQLNIKGVEVHTSSGLGGQDLVNYGYQDIQPLENQMSVIDMAYLTRSLVLAYPDIINVTSKKEIVVGKLNGVEEKIEATNELLFADERVKGFKTGSSPATWSSNLTFFAEANNIRVIGVRIGAYDRHDRLEEAKEMVNFTFSKVYQHPIITMQAKLFNENSQIPVQNGLRGKVKVGVAKNLTIMSSFDKLDPKYIFIPTNKKYDQQTQAFYAPIKKGEQLGTVTVVYRDLSYISSDTSQSLSVPVIALEDVQNGFYLFNWLQSLLREFLNIFQ